MEPSNGCIDPKFKVYANPGPIRNVMWVPLPASPPRALGCKKATTHRQYPGMIDDRVRVGDSNCPFLLAVLALALAGSFLFLQTRRERIGILRLPGAKGAFI